MIWLQISLFIIQSLQKLLWLLIVCQALSDLFDPHNDLWWVLLLSSFNRWWNWGTEKLRKLPEATQQAIALGFESRLFGSELLFLILVLNCLHWFPAYFPDAMPLPSWLATVLPDLLGCKLSIPFPRACYYALISPVLRGSFWGLLPHSPDAHSTQEALCASTSYIL